MWSLGYVQVPNESENTRDQKETEKILINNLIPSVTEVTDGKSSPTANLESSITSTDAQFESERSEVVPCATMRKLEHQTVEIDEDFVFIEPSHFKETINKSILKTGFNFILFNKF